MNTATFQRAICDNFQEPPPLPPGTEIFPGKLYLTSKYEANDLEFLNSRGVTAILTICQENVGSHVPAEIEKLHIDVADDCRSIVSEYFDLMADFIDQNECVLVHCYAGISRSSTAVLAYLMAKKHFTFEEAYSFLRAKRNIINPNLSFIGQLKTFEDQLKDNRNCNNMNKMYAKRSKPTLINIEEIDSGVDTESSGESVPGSPSVEMNNIEFNELNEHKFN